MNMSFLDEYPDSILLQILSYLPVKERCLAGRVCKKWKRVTNDNSLWRHVDLTPYKLNLRKTWKLIRGHLSECLLTIKFRGFLDAKGTNWKKATVSDAVLEDLQLRCPNIQELVLYQMYIDNVDSRKLPSSLISLTLEGCSWTKGWLRNTKLPNLQSLHLDKTTRIDHTEIEDIVKFTTIETLSMRGCYRIGEKSIRMISENFPNLLYLDISECECTDLAIHFVSRNMKGLKRLSVSSCKNITNDALHTMASSLKNLEFLDISRCSKIDESCLDSLLKIKSLNTLIHSVKMSEERRQSLELIYPNLDKRIREH